MRLAKICLLGAVLLLLTGCEVVSSTHPIIARERALAIPEVAAWMQDHSAPRVLEGMSKQQALAWRRYVPSLIVDRVSEGLVVRLESRLGAEPRRVQVLLDRESGQVVEVLMGEE